MNEHVVMVEAGISFHQRGEFEEANSCYQRALALAPDSGKTWHLCGRLAMDIGLLGEAEAFVARAIELAPDGAEYALTMGAVLAAQGKNEEAREFFNKALELNPALEEAYVGLSTTFLAERRFEEARALAEPLSFLGGAVGSRALAVVGECAFAQDQLAGVFKWWKTHGVDLSGGMILHVG